MPFSFRCQVWGYVWHHGHHVLCRHLFVFGQLVKLAKTVKNHCLTRFSVEEFQPLLCGGLCHPIESPCGAGNLQYTPFSQDFWEGQPSDNPKSSWSFLREENYPRSVVHITCDTYLLISCNRSFCSKLSIQKYHVQMIKWFGRVVMQTNRLPWPPFNDEGQRDL